MPSTYTLISSNTLTTTTATVTFSSIPATFTDLVLRLSTRTDLADTNVPIYTRFNGDTASNYSGTFVQSNGAGTASGRGSNQTFLPTGPYSEGTNYTSNVYASDELYIPSYLASQNKPVGGFAVAENNATGGHDIAYAGLWRNTAAITTILLYPYSGNFVSGSSFYLYGIKNS